MHISLLRDLLHNEAHEYFLSPFYYLKSRENHTDQMTKNELMAVTLVRQRPQVQVLTRVGVVEAASSSLVTQTKIGGSIEPPIFFYFLANSLEISRFRNKHNGLVLPCFKG